MGIFYDLGSLFGIDLSKPTPYDSSECLKQQYAARQYSTFTSTASSASDPLRVRYPSRALEASTCDHCGSKAKADDNQKCVNCAAPLA